MNIASIWRSLSRNGLKDDEGVFGHREVIFLNKILVLGPIVMLLLIPIEVAVNGFKLVPLELVFMSMMLLCFALQRYRFFMTSKFLAVFLSQSFIVGAGVMVGKGVANHIALIPICLFGMLLFEKTRDKALVLGITVFSYFLQAYLRNHVPATYALSDEVKAFFTHVFYLMTLILTFFMGIYFLGINKEYEELIIEQKEILAVKNREVTDSIRYAKKIQQCLLAHDEFLNNNLPLHFVLYRPKDIVSGDFYWATKVSENGNEFFYLAVCDSTGHGVPGAFMSLLNTSFLNEAINEKKIREPGKIFDHVRKRLTESISKEGQKDGFDGILICINPKNPKIQYAAANNQPILVKNGACIELEADRMPVGVGERHNEFSSFEISVSIGDTLYLYTDGFADQFGGPKGKKFKYSQLNNTLSGISQKNENDQKEILMRAFDEWKGSLEQVDDVCVVGIRF